MENQELIKQVTEKAEKWLTPAYDAETQAEVKRMLENDDKTDKMFAFTGGGFCAFPGFIDPSGAMGASYLIYVIIAIVVSSVISFLLTYATYKEDVPAVEAAK